MFFFVVVLILFSVCYQMNQFVKPVWPISSVWIFLSSCKNRHEPAIILMHVSIQSERVLRNASQLTTATWPVHHTLHTYTISSHQIASQTNRRNDKENRIAFAKKKQQAHHSLVCFFFVFEVALLIFSTFIYHFIWEIIITLFLPQKPSRTKEQEIKEKVLFNIRVCILCIWNRI